MDAGVPLLNWLIPAIVLVYGGVFGSFFTCVVHRWPRGESLRQPPSQCPRCGTRLGLPDLIPVFSWLMLRGRCRHCGVAVSGRYVLLELLTSATGLLALCLTGLSWWAVIAVPLSWALLLGLLLRLKIGAPTNGQRL